MSLIAIPAFAQVEDIRIAQGSDASTLASSIAQALASVPPPQAFLADLQLAAGGAGALWEVALVFTDEPDELTPIAAVPTLRFRVVTAPTRAALEAAIHRAIDDLVNQLPGEAIQWLAKIAQAGAGAGAVFAAIVMGSTSARPVPPVIPPQSIEAAKYEGGPIVVPGDNTVTPLVTIVGHISQTGAVVTAASFVGTPTYHSLASVYSLTSLLFQGLVRGQVSDPIEPAALPQFTLAAQTKFIAGIGVPTNYVLAAQHLSGSGGGAADTLEVHAACLSVRDCAP